MDASVTLKLSVPEFDLLRRALETYAFERKKVSQDSEVHASLRREARAQNYAALSLFYRLR